MGTIYELDPATLADDDLYTLFAVADEADDQQLAKACNDEITRRSQLPATTVHEVPAWLARLLPRGMWHQKPEGEGGG